MYPPTEPSPPHSTAPIQGLPTRATAEPSFTTQIALVKTSTDDAPSPSPSPAPAPTTRGSRNATSVTAGGDARRFFLDGALDEDSRSPCK